MARDENNGELPWSQRFYYATSRDAYKKAHRSARFEGQEMFWFNQKLRYVSRGYGDSLNAWNESPAMKYYFSSKKELYARINWMRSARGTREVA